MIDVPIAVRDALKDGGYKKNYRFIVGDVLEEPVYTTETTLENNTPYTLTKNGEYILHNDNHYSGFTYVINNNATVVNEMDVDLSGGYYVDLGELHIGDVVKVISNYYSLDLQIQTTQTEEVFAPQFEIENDRLVKESVKIDERMCSDDTLKFGLCEGTSIEFQAFNIDNITNNRIRAFVDVEYPVITYDYDEATNKTTRYETIETYTIPMGWFDVQETSRQASTGIRKISAYNKLKSDYLDQQVNALIIEEFGTATVRILDILQFLLSRYGIKTIESETINVGNTTHQSSAPKKSFSPYQYTDYASWSMGAFTSYPFRKPDPLSLSTKFYMQGVADLKRYYLWTVPSANLPIRIEIDEVVEQLDTIIATYIQDQFAILANYCNTTAADLWNRLINMKPATQNVEEVLTYFFYVRIAFKDNSPSRIYGNNLPNGVATGTFAQMSRTTFLNVSNVYICTPVGIKYGYQFDKTTGNIYLADASYWNGHETFINFVPLYGREQDSMRVPPRMPDGTEIPRDIAQFFKVKTLTSGYSPAELIEVDPTKLASVTLRDLQTAVFETNCQFGRLDRINNYFTGVELNNGRLYPAEDLYPDDALYPMSQSESGFRAMYSKLWADEGNIRKWRNLNITYKGLVENEDTQEHEEGEKIYTAVVDADGTDDYDVTANWLFKNLLWADSESESWQEAAGLENIEDYADAMVAKMQSVQWFPFEMWCAGLPYVETGDEVEINIGNYAYTSYVLRRTIKGIQNLQDEMINGTLDIF